MIEADLLRFYGVDLQRHLGTRKLTWRRLRVLIDKLPRESLFVQRLAGPLARWGDAEHLLASAIDELRLLSFYYLGVHGERAPAPPRMVPRPGAPSPADARPLNLKEFAAQFGHLMS